MTALSKRRKGSSYISLLTSIGYILEKRKTLSCYMYIFAYSIRVRLTQLKLINVPKHISLMTVLLYHLRFFSFFVLPWICEKLICSLNIDAGEEAACLWIIKSCHIVCRYILPDIMASLCNSAWTNFHVSLLLLLLWWHFNIIHW